MSNKIIYPILIILFTILIIYSIISTKFNNKLNYNIEKFKNNYLENNASNNNNFMKDLANGSWTTLNSTVDANYNVHNLMNINIVNVIGSVKNINDKKIGSILFLGSLFDITFAVDDNLIAVSNNFDILNLHIKFGDVKKKDSDIFYKTETEEAIVSIYFGNLLILRYASYKIYNDKAGAEVYRIIKSGDFFVEQPPPIYDYKAYNTLIGNYLFPTNYIKFNFGTTNTNIQSIINDKYFGKLQFSIQRVFSSPTGNDIITKNSPPVLLSALSNGQIPTTITIAPFVQDKNANALISFFKPKATIVYFYKLIDINISYAYGDNNLKNVPNNVFNLQNNATTLFEPIVSYNNLSTVEQINTNKYQMTLLLPTPAISNLSDPTIINFSEIYSLL